MVIVQFSIVEKLALMSMPSPYEDWANSIAFPPQSRVTLSAAIVIALPLLVTFSDKV